MTEKWHEAAVKWKQLGKRYFYVLLAAAAGVVLLAWPAGKSAQQESAAGEAETVFYDLEETEERLAAVLGEIRGVGRVRVMLTLKELGEQRYAADEEAGADREKRSLVVLNRGSGVQQAVPVSRGAPVYQGALIVCTGGDDPAVRLAVTGAVADLTGLGADRITVCAGAE